MARVFPEHETRIGSVADRHGELGLATEDVCAIYRTMVTARAVDQKLWNLSRTRKIPFMIPGQGQEAAQVGSAMTLRRGHDMVLPYYRDVGVVLALSLIHI